MLDQGFIDVTRCNSQRYMTSMPIYHQILEKIPINTSSVPVKIQCIQRTIVIGAACVKPYAVRRSLKSQEGVIMSNFNNDRLVYQIIYY